MDVAESAFAVSHASWMCCPSGNPQVSRASAALRSAACGYGSRAVLRVQCFSGGNLHQPGVLRAALLLWPRLSW